MKKAIIFLFLAITYVFAFEEINEADFAEKTKGQDVIIEFFAHWCPVCKDVEEHLDFHNQRNKDVKIYKINVELNKEFSLKHNAQSLPTLLYIKNGEIVYTQSGFHDYKAIKKNINKHIKD